MRGGDERRPAYTDASAGAKPHREGIKSEGVRRVGVRVDKNSCTGCGVCVEECPRGAISVREVAAVNADLCTECGLCVRACPNGSISIGVR